MSKNYNEPEEKIDFSETLKSMALWGGIAIAIISIYFSYDGLDQTITGGNPNYTEIAKYIGWAMAIVVTLVQFIFNSDFNKLSTTLKLVGIASYVYSLYTNYLGLSHLFGFTGVVGGLIAVFMDVTPEALIAWSLEDQLSGDMLGNLGKMLPRTRPARSQQKAYTFTPEQTNVQKKPKFNPKYRPAKSRDDKNEFFKFGE